MNHTMLQRRPSGYYFRQRVPDELRSVIGKNEIVRSLGTNDHATARRKVKVVAIEVDRLFAEARTTLQSPALLPREPFDAAKLLAQYLAASLDADEVYRKSAASITEDRLERDLEALAMQQAEAREALALRKPTHVAQRVASKLLADREDVTDEERRAFTFGIQQAILKGLEVGERRAQGDWSDTVPVASALPSVNPEPPAAPPAPVVVSQPSSSSSERLTLTQALEGWRAERKPSRSTGIMWTAYVRRFVEMNGDLPVDQITRRQIGGLKEAVQAEGKGISSVQKSVNALKSILGWAVEAGHLDTNPAIGIRVRDPQAGKSSRLPFSNTDIQAIFEATRDETGARHWLPRLGLWTGARLGELCQLEVSDVRHEGEITYLDLNEEGENKSLKNASSKRRIPLHPAAIQTGFLDYVATLDPAGPLFPDIKLDVHGSRARPYTKVFGRLLDRIGIKDRDKVFHSFRHSFKDACRAAGLEEAVHDALTGHSGGGVGRRYGHGFTVERLAEEIVRIHF